MIRLHTLYDYRGLHAREPAIVQRVRSTVSQTLQVIGEGVSDSVTVTRDGITAALQTTVEEAPGLCCAPSASPQGWGWGCVTVGGARLRVAQHAVQGTMAGAAEMGAEGATVVQRARRGVMEAAQSAPQETLEAAGTRRRTAVKAVTDVLIGVVEDGKDVLGAMLPRGASITASGLSSSPSSAGPALTQQQDTEVSFPNTHITRGEHRFGYPVTSHPVSSIRRRGLQPSPWPLSAC
jgi:hypothetical protein